MKKTAILFAAALIATSLTGCKGSEKADAKADAAPKASMGVVNSKCPMMTSHPAGTKVTADFKGQKVGFCCAGCLPAWNKLTDEQKAEKLNAAK
jgi:hypothetical protein